VEEKSVTLPLHQSTRSLQNVSVQTGNLNIKNYTKYKLANSTQIGAVWPPTGSLAVIIVCVTN
jgi:hypothetical protein